MLETRDLTIRFGGHVAVSVPGANAQLTLLTATCPPKRMVRSSVSSIVGHCK